MGVFALPAARYVEPLARGQLHVGAAEPAAIPGHPQPPTAPDGRSHSSAKERSRRKRAPRDLDQPGIYPQIRPLAANLANEHNPRGWLVDFSGAVWPAGFDRSDIVKVGPGHCGAGGLDRPAKVGRERARGGGGGAGFVQVKP